MLPRAGTTNHLSQWGQCLAESYLTRRLFRQIVERIERLAWHPT